MPLNEKQRKRQASKAGKKSGKVRGTQNKPRDANIYNAYSYLSGGPQSKEDTRKTVEFLTSKKISVNLRMNAERGLKPSVALAACFNLSPRTIVDIFKKTQLDKNS